MAFVPMLTLVMILTEKSLASVKVGMWQYFLHRSRLVRESIVWVSISKVFFLCVLQVDNFCTIKVKRNTQFSLCFFCVCVTKDSDSLYRGRCYRMCVR